MITILDYTEGDYDLTSLIEVGSFTPDPTSTRSVSLRLILGYTDPSSSSSLSPGNELDGTGGDFEISIEIDDKPYVNQEVVTLGAYTTAIIQTNDLIVPAGSVISVFVLSPNAGDVSVRVRAELYGEAVNSPTQIIVSSPVTATGTLNPIIIGDDYKVSNSRAFEWTFEAIDNFTPASCSVKFGGKLPNDQTEAFLVEDGTVSNLGGGLWKAVVELDKDDTEGLTAGLYDWSVEVTEGGEEVTIARNNSNNTRVRLVEKQT